MAVLYHPSFDPSRVYYGTDTRAFGLLFGAALAMVWPSRRLSRKIDGRRAQHARRRRRRRPAGDRADDLAHRPVLAVPLPRRLRAALAGDGAGWSPRWPTRPAASAGSLGCAPLRWIGVRSYGIYLWHCPIIVLTTPAGAARPPNLLRAALQVAAIFGDRRALLELRRGADPPRRAGPAVGAGAHGPLAAADAPPGGAHVARRSDRAAGPDLARARRRQAAGDLELGVGRLH